MKVKILTGTFNGRFCILINPTCATAREQKIERLSYFLNLKSLQDNKEMSNFKNNF